LAMALFENSLIWFRFQDNNGTIENEELRGFLKDLLELVKKVGIAGWDFGPVANFACCRITTLRICSISRRRSCEASTTTKTARSTRRS
jgi:hypothetical protein